MQLPLVAYVCGVCVLIFFVLSVKTPRPAVNPCLYAFMLGWLPPCLSVCGKPLLISWTFSLIAIQDVGGLKLALPTLTLGLPFYTVP